LPGASSRKPALRPFPGLRAIRAGTRPKPPIESFRGRTWLCYGVHAVISTADTYARNWRPAPAAVRQVGRKPAYAPSAELFGRAAGARGAEGRDDPLCDLVESTKLAERLDLEALQRLLARYFVGARTIVERHGHGRAFEFVTHRQDSRSVFEVFVLEFFRGSNSTAKSNAMTASVEKTPMTRITPASGKTRQEMMTTAP